MNNLSIAHPPLAARHTEPRPALPSVPSVASAALLQGHNVVHIEHNGALYQLRSTRLGKLILTK